MASAIEDVSSLPGETVTDQDGRKIGEVRDIYAVGDDETPMWVTIESSTGIGRSRRVFVPLARLKQQGDEIRVPYSYSHIQEAPEVEPGDEISEEDDRALRSYYAVGLADQELVGAAQSYASQVPDEDGPARKIDASEAEGMVRDIDDTPPAERAAKAYEAEQEEKGDEHRKPREATAEDVVDQDEEKSDSGEATPNDESDEKTDSDDEKPTAEAAEKSDSGEATPNDESDEKSDSDD
jgi:sporulation protein YlmC with PRC-barrel domain